MKHILFYLFTLLTTFSITAQPKQEFRAVWLATNYQIDWPSVAYKNSNDINIQQEEFINILDKLKEANVNMIFLQTRCQGAVIYRSKIEPITPFIAGVENTWSKYDPLDFAIKECHKRGIECHAWFVAYNAGVIDKASACVTKNFELVKKGEKEYWFDPGNPGTNRYLLSLIKELVAGYDLDGFHLDYIRYPGETSDFPDEDSYKRYGNGMNKGDWRRMNVNNFVAEVYDTVKARKPWVQVSSAVVPYYKQLEAGRNHWTAYFDTFQDPEEWLRQGKMDFIVPMTYNKGNLFDLAIADWTTRCNGRYVIPGIGAYFLDEKEKGGNWTLKNISDQLLSVREKQSPGHCLYSAKFLTNNKKGLHSELKTKFYKTPALIPPLPWLSQIEPPAPNRPKAMPAGEYLFLKWDELKAPANNKYYYNVYRSQTSPVDINDPSNLLQARVDGNSLFIPADKNGFHYVVTAYDRYHNESPASKEIFFKP